MNDRYPFNIRSIRECSLKGGSDSSPTKMETKSRYEVIAELEQQKINLIRERESFKDQVQSREKEIKETKRELEDQEEELKLLKESIEERKAIINELIQAKEESLKRFSVIQTQKK